MNFLRLLPVIISLILLAAHFLRAGQTVIVVVLVLLALLLFIKKSWVPGVIQLSLLLGAVEWARTLMSVAHIRMEYGMPWTRMALILGAVALFTVCSGLVFRNTNLRKRYSEKTAPPRA